MALLPGAFASIQAPAAKSSDSLKKMAALEVKQQAAKSAHMKKPRDERLKKTYVDLTVDLGVLAMTSPDLSSKEKYPKALRLFREALKTDPKNRTALHWKTQIEDIYRSMGKPIPKG